MMMRRGGPMGDATDMLLDGTLCSDCGAVFDDHDSPGHPRSCCGEDRKQEKQERRDRAASDFGDASRLASEHGLRLVRHSEQHYKLQNPDWTLEVYPGNRRLYRSHGQTPYLRLRAAWTLVDVVRGAIAAARDADSG